MLFDVGLMAGFCLLCTYRLILFWAILESLYGDIIQWDQPNRSYIMTHGVSGIEWKHYKHPLLENIYDVYM
jgi:hypothetical protein